MGKAGRWLRSFLAGKKDGKVRERERQGEGGDATPVAASAREKKRWSFRRPAAPGRASAAASSPATPEPSVSGGAGFLRGRGCLSVSERDLEQSKHAMAVVVATAAATDAAHAAAAVIRLTASESDLSANIDEEAAAVRIQATFRGYLARKALCALRGLVKLQALIRGHLVRKQATATLRRMQALLMAQSRLRAQGLRMLDDDDGGHPPPCPAHRRSSPQHPRHRRSYEMDRSGEEHVKIVEMDIGEPPRRGRSSCSESRERRLSEYYGVGQCSPAPSAAFSELMSPRAYSGHFEDFAPFEPATARSSPYVPAANAEPAASEFFPNYMANTESSRAKARSQSAPRQRTDSPLERQPSRRRGGAAVPRSVKMQRSSSHVGVPAAGGLAHLQYQYPYPWPVKLDRSSASLKDSECGSTSSVLTAATVAYCRSLVGFKVRGGNNSHPHRLPRAETPMHSFVN